MASPTSRAGIALITDPEMERRACLVFCDRCGRVVNR